MHDFWYALWFFLPAGAANLMPVFAAHIPLLKHWDTPLDNGLSYRGRRLFGKSKTWRGIVSGMLVAIIVFWLQKKLAPHLGSFHNYLETVGYNHLSLWLGALLGLGALVGDAVESFFKRQVGVESGKSWFPFDQLDYIVGGVGLSLLVTRLPFHLYVWIVGVWFVTHLIFSYWGYLLHFKKTPI